LLPPPPGPRVTQGPLSTNQNSLSPFGVPYPGYGVPSYGGAATAASSYTPQQFLSSQYSLPYHQPYLTPSYPPPGPPSTESDVSHPQNLALEEKETELEDLIKKIAKLKGELLNWKPSGQLLYQAEKLARLEKDLDLQRIIDEERAATVQREIWKEKLRKNGTQNGLLRFDVNN
jgi:hypothetical protein